MTETFLVFVLLGAVIGGLWKQTRKATLIGAAIGVAAYAVTVVVVMAFLAAAFR
ncbi:MAG TPA: hypothetical protein V6C81_11580 [Planktothrix sp.]|jgi:hypothetical protein